MWHIKRPQQSVEFRTSSSLTCGDIDVCDVHGAIQGLGRADIVQDVPEGLQCPEVCNVQLHIH